MSKTDATWEPNVLLESRQLAQFDAAALTHVVSGAQFEHRRLPGGGSDIKLLQCVLPNSVLNRGIYEPAMLVQGTFAPGAITIGTMLRQARQTLLNGSLVKTGTIQFYAENSEISYRAWPNGTWLAFEIPRERLLAFGLEQFDAVPSLPKTGVTHIEPASIAIGYQLLDRLRDLDWSLQPISSLRNAGRIGSSVERDLMIRISRILCQTSAKRTAGDRRRIRHCREMIRDAMSLVERDPDEMLDLQSMSQATGLSPRTLQRAFQAEYGLCPQEWFRVERLNRVREELLHGGSVTQAATRWGFFHFSRFAQYYRELFGERPSETMRSRRAAGLARAASA